MKLKILLIMLVLLIGCTTQPIQDNTEQPVLRQQSVVKETVASEKVFDIRIQDNVMDPDTITVNKGDIVKLSIATIMNKPDDEMRTGGKLNEPRRFVIEEYNIEEMLYEGNALEIEFIASKTGEFDFGDPTSTTLKGRLVVI